MTVWAIRCLRFDQPDRATDSERKDRFLPWQFLHTWQSKKPRGLKSLRENGFCIRALYNFSRAINDGNMSGFSSPVPKFSAAL
jgi:hypothetical protein